MILTPVMATAGLIAALCQFAAHHLMRERRYKTPRTRYVVGSAIVLVCFAIGWAVDPSQHPTIALLYIYAASYVGTRVGYATDPKPQPKQRPSADDLEKWAGAIVAEHTDNESGHGD